MLAVRSHARAPAAVINFQTARRPGAFASGFFITAAICIKASVAPTEIDFGVYLN
jgi:hypothetical protein